MSSNVRLRITLELDLMIREHRHYGGHYANALISYCPNLMNEQILFFSFMTLYDEARLVSF